MESETKELEAFSNSPKQLLCQTCNDSTNEEKDKEETPLSPEQKAIVQNILGYFKPSTHFSSKFGSSSGSNKISPSESTESNRSVKTRKWELKETIRCAFCKGSRCPRCGPNAHMNCTNSPITKFHCNWITDEILAMQRPSDEVFKSQNLVESFRSLGITAVINLTEPGEHPYCGFGLKQSGFPYSPEHFMAAGIKHMNFPWRDMTAPSMPLTKNIVRCGLSELQHCGKVAVHCHAGFGRTGIVVACLLIARHHMSAQNAVDTVRRKRPGSVQTSAQLNFITEFAIVYENQTKVYPSEASEQKKTIEISISDEILCHTSPDEINKFHYKYNVSQVVSMTINNLLKLYTNEYGLISGICGLNFNTSVLALHDDATEDELLERYFLHFVNTNSNLIVNEEILNTFKEYANRTQWEKWASLSGDPTTLDESPFNCKTKAISLENSKDCPTGESIDDESSQKQIILATNASLLLDWIDTRVDKVFNKEAIDKLWTVCDQFNVVPHGLPLFIVNCLKKCHVAAFKASDFNLFKMGSFRSQKIAVKTHHTVAFDHEIINTLRKCLPTYALHLFYKIVVLVRSIVTNSNFSSNSPALLAVIRLSISCIDNSVQCLTECVNGRSLNLSAMKSILQKCTQRKVPADSPWPNVILICYVLYVLAESNWNYISEPTSLIHWKSEKIRVK